MSEDIITAEAYWKLYGEKVFAAIKDNSDDFKEIKDSVLELEKIAKNNQIAIAQIQESIKTISQIDGRVEDIRNARIACSARHAEEGRNTAVEVSLLAERVKVQTDKSSRQISFGVSIAVGVVMMILEFIFNHTGKKVETAINSKDSVKVEVNKGN
jgi:hypothetical protein